MSPSFATSPRSRCGTRRMGRWNQRPFWAHHFCPSKFLTANSEQRTAGRFGRSSEAPHRSVYRYLHEGCTANAQGKIFACEGWIMDTLPRLSPKQSEALDVLVDLFRQSEMGNTEARSTFVGIAIVIAT